MELSDEQVLQYRVRAIELAHLVIYNSSNMPEDVLEYARKIERYLLRELPIYIEADGDGGE